MGGTGLEPVTPSLSIWCSRSRPFARVRSGSIVERNRPATERSSERERTLILASLATRATLRGWGSTRNTRVDSAARNVSELKTRPLGPFLRPMGSVPTFLRPQAPRHSPQIPDRGVRHPTTLEPVVATARKRRACATIAEMARLRLLIVDDHEDFRRSAETLLELEGFDVVGIAEDGLSALSAVEALRPDVVLLDVQLPGMDGFEVVRRLQARQEQTRVVLISSRDSSAYASELVAAPVLGFVAKSELSGAALHALVA